MRRALAVAATLALLFASPRLANAAEPPRVVRFDPKGKVRAVRSLARTEIGAILKPSTADLIAILETPEGRVHLLELSTSKLEGAKGDVSIPSRTWPCDGPEAGLRAGCSVVVVRGRTELRRRAGEEWSEAVLLGPAGFVSLQGEIAVATPSIFRRTAGSPMAFWDGALPVSALEDDALVCPTPDGKVLVDGKPLGLQLVDEANRSDLELFERDARIASLRAADLDGDGKVELLSLVGTELWIWKDEGGTLASKVPIPFLVRDPKLPPEEIRTPRLEIADADRDGKADLLVTLVQGRADKIGGLRTSLYRFPGPFFDPKTSALVEPQPRIDTESVALHPRFVDVDGDGALDYVADSIRGTIMDLVARIMGREPTIWHTVFRFDKAKNAFERKPWATIERPYSSDEAKGNRFGRNAFFDGDFDGDGAKDLLDLGNLKSVTILAGAKSGSDAFRREILPKMPVDKPLATDAVIADLDGDGRSDAVVWNDDGLLLIVSGGAK